MDTASSATPRLSLTLDVTNLGDDSRREFVEKVNDLYLEYIEQDEPMILGWTADTLDQALKMLEHGGGWVQAEAIRHALGNDGFVDRDTIYEVGKYDEDRTLKGWTKPVTRVVSRMKAAGTIPENAADLVQSSYAHGPTADGFRVPADLADLWEWE